MAVMAWGNAVGGAGCLDLFVFIFPVTPPGFGVSGLQKSAAAAATVIVGTVGCHIDKVFFTDHGFYDEPEVFGHRITQTFPDQLTGILGGELDFQVLVPVGADPEFAITDPLGVVFDDASDFKIVGNVEFFQSGPDCEKFVASFSIEPDLAP